MLANAQVAPQNINKLCEIFHSGTWQSRARAPNSAFEPSDFLALPVLLHELRRFGAVRVLTHPSQQSPQGNAPQICETILRSSGFANRILHLPEDVFQVAALAEAGIPCFYDLSDRGTKPELMSFEHRKNLSVTLKCCEHAMLPQDFLSCRRFLHFNHHVPFLFGLRQDSGLCVHRALFSQKSGRQRREGPKVQDVFQKLGAAGEVGEQLLQEYLRLHVVPSKFRLQNLVSLGSAFGWDWRTKGRTPNSPAQPPSLPSPPTQKKKRTKQRITKTLTAPVTGGGNWGCQAGVPKLGLPKL